MAEIGFDSAGHWGPAFMGGPIAFRRPSAETSKGKADVRTQSLHQGLGYADADNQRAMQLSRANQEAALLAARNQQGRFNTIFPYLRNTMTSNNKNLAGMTSGVGSSPGITVGPIWNDQQINQRVNAQTAQNDQRTAGQMRGQQSQMGSQGFGARSPLLAALQGQAMASNMATNTSNARETRINMAGANAQHLLGAEQAREGQYATRQQEDIARRKPLYDQTNALIAALAGLA